MMDSASDAITFTNPSSLAWPHLGLELVVYLGFALTVRHALGEYRRGNGFHAFQWVVIFIYGLIMELVSFNFIDNYAHATFTVQFYHGLLPLYVTCIYVVFHYTGIKLVERLRLPTIQEGLLCGLAIMAIDVPFDTLGVDAGWWVWKDNSEIALHARLIDAVATRFYNVPVTSYYWYLMYGALLAMFCRTAYPWVQNRSLSARLAAAPLVSVSVFVAGALAFELMLWTPARFGIGHGTSVAVYLGVVWSYALTVRAPTARPIPGWIVFNVGLFYAFHLGLLLSLWAGGGLEAPAVKLSLVLLAATGLTLLSKFFPLRSGGRAAAPAPANAAVVRSLRRA